MKFALSDIVMVFTETILRYPNCSVIVRIFYPANRYPGRDFIKQEVTTIYVVSSGACQKGEAMNERGIPKIVEQNERANRMSHTNIRSRVLRRFLGPLQ